MKLRTKKQITRGGVLTVVSIGLVLAFNSSATDLSSEPALPATVNPAEIDSHNDVVGLEKTIEINFSPEKRLMLRRALDEYARSVDHDHDQIEARRRAMRESIKERFFAADVDFDNHINRQEATQSLPQIARHFSAVDQNDDGLIALHELQAAQTRMMQRRQAAQDAINMRKLIGESVRQSDRKSTQASNDQSAESAL